MIAASVKLLQCAMSRFMPVCFLGCLCHRYVVCMGLQCVVYSPQHACRQHDDLQEDNLNLKAQVLDEGHMVMLATQEINELKSLIEVLRAGKPTTADFGCTAAPETADVACGLGKGAQWDGMLSPIAAARARRRTDLGVNRLACDLVPEGVDVQSLDTAVLRLGLIKPTVSLQRSSVSACKAELQLPLCQIVNSVCFCTTATADPCESYRIRASFHPFLLSSSRQN